MLCLMVKMFFKLLKYWMYQKNIWKLGYNYIFAINSLGDLEENNSNYPCDIYLKSGMSTLSISLDCYDSEKMNSFKKYLLSAYCVSSSVLTPGIQWRTCQMRSVFAELKFKWRIKTSNSYIWVNITKLSNTRNGNIWQFGKSKRNALGKWHLSWDHQGKGHICDSILSISKAWGIWGTVEFRKINMMSNEEVKDNSYENTLWHG